ncbi:MFS transporter [Flavihumibacter sp. UBA7668]|uniref:MFS transporter n=1 Tax=Flavihumibacter sp. UBA7668 TaxID=1946542 RepID=UPI0025BF1ADD|nr:MFS transporter [Flavihumibacter sp. UBA7668]
MQLTPSFAISGSRRLPAMADSTGLRYFNFIALYFAQGIPEGMLTFGIPAWLAMNGKSPGEIAAFTNMAVLPWSFKFIVAPIMDRYTYLPMGRKRPWVLVGQAGLVLSCILMAYEPDPLNNLNRLMLLAFVVASFGALQDVATDGMAVDIIPAHQQARANGLMWGSKIVGMSVSLAIGSWLLSSYGFKAAIWMMAIVIGTTMLVPAFLREKQGERIAPWTKGQASPENLKWQLTNWRQIFQSLYRVFTLRNSILIALVLFVCQGGFKYMSTIMPIFTVMELGWTNVDYSQYYATAKLAGGLAGMLLGGILIDKFGKKRMLNSYLLGMIVCVSILAFSTRYWNDRSFIFAFMLAYNLLYTFSCIAVFAIAMQCCWKKVSASQFTLYMTVANLGQIVFSGFIGPIKSVFGWELSLFAFALIIGIAWLILQFVDIDKQISRVVDLETKDV